MDPFSVVCGVAGLLGTAQLVVEKGWAIWQLIKTAGDYKNDIFDILMEVNGLCGVLLALGSVVDRLPDTDGAGQKYAAKGQHIFSCNEILEKILEALEKCAPKDNRKSRNLKKSLLWPLCKQDTIDMLGRLESHKNTFILALSSDTLTKVMSLFDQIEISNSQLVEVRSEQERVAKEKIEEDRRAKLHWLFSGDPEEKHKDIRKKRHEGTGNWFFLTEEYKNWAHEPGSWLFCHGDPGAGKTVFTSTVLDHMANKFPGQDHGIANIYFDFKDQDSQSPVKIFASVLCQLCYCKPKLPAEIEALYRKGKTPDLQELVDAIISVAQSFSRVWLFFDALDECDKKTQRIGLLSSLGRLMGTNINGFATSRPHASDIQSTFNSAVKLEISANEEDVEMTVRYRLTTHKPAPKSELVEEIITRIVPKTNGMFLLAAFQVDCILAQPNPRKMRQILGKLPTGLDATYNDIIDKIKRQEEAQKELALKVLAWVSSSTRPLRPRELREAVAVEEGDTVMEDDFLTEESILVDLCGGLVVIDENSQTVRFVHYTVQEHFDKNPQILDGAHAMLAETCLTYLCFDTFDIAPDGIMRYDFLANRVKENALYDYAARNWAYHTKFSGEVESVLEIAMGFSESGSRMESAVRLFDIGEWELNNGGKDQVFTSNTLCVAAQAGLSRLTELLIKRGNEEIDLKGGADRRTPLMRAADCGHDTVVRLLVERDDVDADSKDRYGRTPLFFAAKSGHEAVVRLLAEMEDVDADGKNKDGQTPLSRAAGCGHEAVVRLLVGRDDVNADSKDWYRRTPLSFAARFGHEAVVRLLAERGDVNADSKDKYGRTPLSLAAGCGHEAVVRLLLERDDVNADSKNMYGQTPLFHATSCGHEAVVRLLVERDDVNADLEHDKGRTPLS